MLRRSLGSCKRSLGIQDLFEKMAKSQASYGNRFMSGSEKEIHPALLHLCNVEPLCSLSSGMKPQRVTDSHQLLSRLQTCSEKIGWKPLGPSQLSFDAQDSLRNSGSDIGVLDENTAVCAHKPKTTNKPKLLHTSWVYI